MRLSKDFLKRRYLDTRLGGVTINPLIQASNFLMISYTMITISLGLDVSIWLYAPLFMFLVMTAFGLAGLSFRKVQLQTDEDLRYEKQSKLNCSLYHLYYSNLLIMKQLKIEPTTEFLKQLQHTKDISEKKI